MRKYSLVHLVEAYELFSPVLRTQLFLRAREHKIQYNTKVKVLVFCPLRLRFNSNFQSTLKSHRLSTPGLVIKPIYGVNRLGDFPNQLFIFINLLSNIGNTTIYHSRGYNSLSRILIFKQFFNFKTVLDIRGLTYLEPFAQKHKFSFDDLNDSEKSRYKEYKEKLRQSLSKVDGICTVSSGLQDILVEISGKNVAVFPCSVVRFERNPINRVDIRKKYNIPTDAICYVYVGGTQKYQHLEDLVIPFLARQLALEKDAWAVIISFKIEEINDLVLKNGLDKNRLSLLKVDQEYVHQHLQAFDYGLLLRKKSELNDIAQPVKFGEYLSAGLIPIVEKGTGSLELLLKKYNFGKVIQSQSKNNYDTELKASEILEQMNRIKQFVDTEYTISSNCKRENDFYLNLIK